MSFDRSVDTLSQSSDLTSVENLLDYGSVFFGDTIKYASLSQGATTDTWTFKTAAAGTTVVVLVITYTDSTKDTISTIERTT